MKNKAKNVALIGFGYWGKKLYKYLKQNKTFNCKYIYSPSLHCEGKYINNLNLILNDKSIDAVIIATPVDTHFNLVKKCLLANKHVLCEKPLTTKIFEASELFQIAKEKHLSLVTEFTYTFSKGIEEIKTKIRKFGELKYIEAKAWQLGRFKNNVYVSLGSHLLSIVDMFLQLPNFKVEKLDIIKSDKVETGIILLKSENLLANLSCSLNSQKKIFTVNFCCTKGILIYSTEDNEKEKDNLVYALEYFYDILSKKKVDNILRAINVARVLDVLENLE